MKTIVPVILALSGLTLSATHAAEPASGSESNIATPYTAAVASVMVNVGETNASTGKTGNECTAVCMLPSAGSADLSQVSYAQ